MNKISLKNMSKKGLSLIIKTSDGANQFTVFIPKNGAFDLYDTQFSGDVENKLLHKQLKITGSTMEIEAISSPVEVEKSVEVPKLTPDVRTVEYAVEESKKKK